MQSRSTESTWRSWADGWAIYLLPALAILEIGLLFLGLQVFAVAIPLVAVAVWILLRARHRAGASFLGTRACRCLAFDFDGRGRHSQGRHRANEHGVQVLFAGMGLFRCRERIGLGDCV